jgi:hypothetical protein
MSSQAQLNIGLTKPSLDLNTVFGLANSTSGEKFNLKWLKLKSPSDFIVRENSSQKDIAFERAKDTSEQRKFERNLIQSLEKEPFDNGYLHPAESIIKDALKKSNTLASQWIQSLYLENFTRATIAAGIIRCLGYIEPERTDHWIKAIVISGLSHVYIEVREAAVRSLENWGEYDSVVILRAYVELEKETWLKEYIQQVITDLLD